MYQQTELILEQYELEIRQMTKGRGYWICETNEGTKLLCPFKGSKEKGEAIREFLCQLKNSGYPVENVFLNKKGEAVTEEENSLERFWLKDSIEGVTLNTAHLREVIEAA